MVDSAIVTGLPESQHRLAYSLLKPAVRIAAKFGLSFRILSDLLRLAYFEVLSREEGLSTVEIADRFGQTPRHMRSLAKRMESDFFEAEREIGLPREIEAFVSGRPSTLEEVAEHFGRWSLDDLQHALIELTEQGRLDLVEGRYTMNPRYVVLRSEQFPQRIDALNHFLSGATRAVVQRLIHDERDHSMIKTLSFAADPATLHTFIRRLEGELRTELADMDEAARFGDHGANRFTMSLTLASELTDETTNATRKRSDST